MPGGVQGLDRYAYVNNNPVKYIDSDGHNPLLIVIAIVGFAMMMSQYPGDSAYAYQNSEGNGDVMAWGAALMLAPVIVPASCVDDGCANEVQSVMDASQIVNQDGNPTNELSGIKNLVDAASSSAQASSNSVTSIQPYYPPNMGFSGSPQVTTLAPGELVSRYGSPYGSYLSPANTPSSALSLPPGVQNLSYNTYRVIKPIGNILRGKTSSWWGQIGGGMQYYIGSQHGQNVQTLLDSGYLKAE